MTRNSGWLLLLVVHLGCTERARSEPIAVIRPEPSAGSALSQSPPELKVEPLEAKHRALEQHLRNLQDALRRRDRRAFADRLVYPAGVNSVSGCSAVLATPEVFLRYYDQIVTPSLVRTVESSSVPSGCCGAAWSIAGDQIWWPEGARGFVFNSSTSWRLQGLPCYQEQPEALPVNLPRAWRATAACDEAGGPAARHLKADHLELDDAAQSVAFVRGKSSRSCRIDRTSRTELRGKPWMLPCFPPEALGPPMLTMHLDCRGIGESYERLLFVEADALTTYGEGASMTFEPAAR